MAADTTPQDRAIVALNEKFGCDNGTIGSNPAELRYLTATKSTGLGLMDWQKLTLGEIVDCLADAGLLAAEPAEAETHALLLKGYRGYADQVNAMARRIQEQDRQLALALDTLGSIWLYVNWRYVSKQLTTEQKELWADAVDEFGDPADRGPKAERWWRDDAPAPAHDEVLDRLRAAMNRGPKPRLRACVEAWPECETGAYNPSCCRFPSSCSATVYDEKAVEPEDLEDRRG